MPLSSYLELSTTLASITMRCIDDFSGTSAPLRAPMGLHARARKAIRDEVGEVAMNLFLDQGFDETTVDQICTAAGLSRSSFFRYFPTKEDVVLESVSSTGDHIARALRQRPDTEQPWVALRNAFESQVRLLADDVEWYLQLSRLVTQTASVRARQLERTLAWRELLVPEIARRLGLPHPSPGDPRAAALVGSAMSCLQAANEAWTQGDGSVSLGTLLDLAMDTVGVRALDAKDAAHP